MRVLICLPTLSRSDLLIRNYTGFADSLEDGDHFFVLDNGKQNLPWQNSDRYICAIPPENLGISRSWNLFLTMAFVDGKYDACIFLQDDIIWTREHVDRAKQLLCTEQHQKVDLFLAHHQFSVQVHRPSNIHTIGFFDESFVLPYCEDDNYALTIISKNRVYKRFHELNPLEGSITEGTPKPHSWEINYQKLVAKWGPHFKYLDSHFRINFPDRHYYETNEHILCVNDHLFIKPRN